MSEYVNTSITVGSVAVATAVAIYCKVRNPNDWSTALRDVLVRANFSPHEYQTIGVSTLSGICLNTMSLIRQSHDISGLKRVLSALDDFNAAEWK